jgi:hypothetical protein
MRVAEKLDWKGLMTLILDVTTEKTRECSLYFTSVWLNNLAEYRGDTVTARYVVTLRQKAKNYANVTSGML